MYPPSPPVDLGNDTAFACNVNSITLYTNASNASTCSWSTGVVSPNIVVNNAGTYWVNVIDACGSSTDTIVVSPFVAALNYLQDTFFCKSANVSLNAAAGYVNYEWNTGANTQNIVVSQVGLYYVNITDNNGCKDSIIKSITVNCQQNNISNIINAYTPVISLNPCNNSITVEDGTAYNTGDTVLIIQMKGADIDSTNTVNFGTITDYQNCGNYEFNYVKSKTGNQIELLNSLTRQYDLPDGKVQLIRVPYYQNATISSTLTCLPWDGNKGGVLVLNVQDSVILNANIDVTGKGFRGGVGFTNNLPPILFKS